MSQTDRISKIARLLDDGRVVTTRSLQERFEVSRATIMRDIEFMRDRMNMPITYASQDRGFVIKRLGFLDTEAIPFPGMWLAKEEAYSLLTLFNIARQFDPGFFTDFIAPLAKPIKRVLGQEGYRMMGLDRKVRIELPFATTPKVRLRLFSVIEQALLLDKTIFVAGQTVEGKAFEGKCQPVRLVLNTGGWAIDVVAEGSQDEASTRIPLRTVAVARPS